jgi:IS30 family transposase
MRWSPEQISGWLSEQGIKLSHERIYQMIWDDKRDGGLASAEDRLPESQHFSECAVILGVVRARSVHKASYGHKCDRAAAPVVA